MSPQVPISSTTPFSAIEAPTGTAALSPIAAGAPTLTGVVYSQLAGGLARALGARSRLTSGEEQVRYG